MSQFLCGGLNRSSIQEFQEITVVLIFENWLILAATSSSSSDNFPPFVCVSVFSHSFNIFVEVQEFGTGTYADDG